MKSFQVMMSSQASGICSTPAQLTTFKLTHMQFQLLMACTAHNAVCTLHVCDDLTKSILQVTDMHSHMHRVRFSVYNLVSMQFQTSMCKRYMVH